MIGSRACAGTLAVLVLTGGAACSRPSGPPAAPQARLAPSQETRHPTGVISGRFVLFGTMGRPGPATYHPARGKVVFTRGGRRVLMVRAGRAGTFLAHLPPGTYHVYGRTPQLTTVSQNGNSREDKITLARHVTVNAGQTTK